MAEKLKKKPKDGQLDEESPWKTRIARMKRYRDKASKNWERNKKLLFGETETQDQKANLYAYGWSLVKSLETSIYVQNPEMAVEPYDAAKREIGTLLSAIANYDLDQMDLKSIGNMGLIDCFINGFFVCIETIETETSTVRYPSEKKGEEDEEVERPEDQRFCAYRVPPKDFLIDPKCRKLDLSDADYCAVYFYPTIAQLRADKKTFPKLPLDVEDFPEASPEKPPAPHHGETRPTPEMTTGGEKDPEYKTIAVIEIHDKVNKKIIYVTDHQMREIGTIDWPVKYKIGGRDLFPITLMAFHTIPDHFWPKPELDLIAPQLTTLNQLDQIIIEDAREKWRKLATLVGLMSGDQAAKLTDLSGHNQLLQVDYEDIKEMAVQMGGTPAQWPDIRNLVVPIEDPQVKKDVLAVREMVKQETMDIVGYGPPDRAGMPRTRSAREAVALKEKLEARLAKRADAVSDFYRLFGAKHLMALQQKAVVDRYVRVFDGAKNLAQYQKYAKEDIDSGTFNFIVYAGTSAPRNTEAKRNSEMQLFQTLAPFAQAGMIPFEPLLLRLGESVQWKGMDMLLRNYKPAVVQLAKTLFSMFTKKGMPPQALPEAAAAVVTAVLSPEQIELIKKELSGQGAVPQRSTEATQARGNPDEMATAAGTM